MIFSGAPKETNVSNTNRLRPRGSFTRVFNFPSENVPAPPSPNCTLDAGFSTPVFQKCKTSSVRSPTFFPRSNTRGLYPSLASRYAQKSPAGPAPITTGRWLKRSVPCSGTLYFFSLTQTAFLFPECFKIFSSLSTHTSTEQTIETSGFFLASIDFFTICNFLI